MKKQNIDRRGFFRLGAGAAVGVSTATAQSPRTYQPGIPAEFTFLVEPGLISRLDKHSLEISKTALWAVSSRFAAAVPALLAPLYTDVAELEEWAKNAFSSGCCSIDSPVVRNSGDPLSVLMSTPFIGGPEVADVIAGNIVSLSDGVGLDLALEFLQRPSYEPPPVFELSNRSSLPVLDVVPAVPTERRSKTSIRSVAAVDLFGWKLQCRGPETHPLGSCVSTPVTHFNVEVFRSLGGGRYAYVANFHLGTYRSNGRRCFVLFNNESPVICWKSCGPTRDDLVQMFKWIIAASASLMGIALVAWVVAAIAEASATVMFPALLLLAV